MCRAAIAVSFLLALPILAKPAPAQLGSGNLVTLSGTVFSDSGNRRIEHALVRLCDPGGNQIQESVTEDSGGFAFRGLPKTNYILTIDAAGYQLQTLHVDLSFSSERGVIVYLKSIQKDTPGSPASISAHEMSMPQPARDLMTSGEKKLYTDKHARASLLDFQQAVSVAPDFYEAYYQMGMAYIALNDEENARKSFQKSIETSTDKFGDAEIALGTMMLNRGDNPDGEKAIRRGLQLTPESWMGHYELGRALLNEHRIPEAQKSAIQARSLAPKAPVIYRLLANIHLQQKDYPALLEDLNAYIALDPSSPAGLKAQELRKQVQTEVAKPGVMAGSSRGNGAQPSAPASAQEPNPHP